MPDDDSICSELLDRESGYDHAYAEFGRESGFAHNYPEFGVDYVGADGMDIIPQLLSADMREREWGAQNTGSFYNRCNRLGQIQSLWEPFVNALRAKIGNADAATALLNRIQAAGWHYVQTVHHLSPDQTHVVSETTERVSPPVIDRSPVITHPVVRVQEITPQVHAQIKAQVRPEHGVVVIDVNKAAFIQALRQRNAFARTLDVLRWHINRLRRVEAPTPLVVYEIAGGFNGEFGADVPGFAHHYPEFGGGYPEFGVDASSSQADIAAFQQAWNAAGNTPALTVDGAWGPATAAAAAASPPTASAGLSPFLQAVQANPPAPSPWAGEIGWEGQIAAREAGGTGDFADAQIARGQLQEIPVVKSAFERLIHERGVLAGEIRNSKRILATLLSRLGHTQPVAVVERLVTHVIRREPEVVKHIVIVDQQPRTVYVDQAPAVQVHERIIREQAPMLVQPLQPLQPIQAMPIAPPVLMDRVRSDWAGKRQEFVETHPNWNQRLPQTLEVNRDAFFALVRRRNQLARRLDHLRHRLSWLRGSEMPKILVQYVFEGVPQEQIVDFGWEGQIAAYQAGGTGEFAEGQIARGDLTTIPMNRWAFENLIRERDWLLWEIDETLHKIAQIEVQRPFPVDIIRWMQGGRPTEQREIDVNLEAFKLLVHQRNALHRKLHRLRCRIARRERTQPPGVPVLFMLRVNGNSSFNGDVWEMDGQNLMQIQYNWQNLWVSRNAFRRILQERNWLLQRVNEAERKLAWLGGTNMNGDGYTDSGTAPATATTTPSSLGLSASILSSSTSTTTPATAGTTPMLVPAAGLAVDKGHARLQTRGLALANGLVLGQPDAFAAANALCMSAVGGDWVSRQMLDSALAVLQRDHAPFFVRNAVEWRTNGVGGSPSPATDASTPSVHGECNLPPQVCRNIESAIRSANLGDQVAVAQLAQLRRDARRNKGSARAEFAYAMRVEKSAVPQPAFGVAFGAEHKRASAHKAAKVAQGHAHAAAHHKAAARTAPTAHAAKQHHLAAAQHERHAENARLQRDERRMEHMEHRLEHGGQPRRVVEYVTRPQQRLQHPHHPKHHDARREVVYVTRGGGGGGGGNGGGGGGGGMDNRAAERALLQQRSTQRHPAFQQSETVRVVEGREPPLRRLLRAAAAGNREALSRVNDIKVAAQRGDVRAKSMLQAMQQMAGTPEIVSNARAAKLSHGKPLTTARVHGIAAEFGAESANVLRGVRSPYAPISPYVTPITRQAIRTGQILGKAQQMQAVRFPGGPIPRSLRYEAL